MHKAKTVKDYAAEGAKVTPIAVAEALARLALTRVFRCVLCGGTHFSMIGESPCPHCGKDVEQERMPL